MSAIAGVDKIDVYNRCDEQRSSVRLRTVLFTLDAQSTPVCTGEHCRMPSEAELRCDGGHWPVAPNGEELRLTDSRSSSQVKARVEAQKDATMLEL